MKKTAHFIVYDNRTLDILRSGSLSPGAGTIEEQENDLHEVAVETDARYAPDALAVSPDDFKVHLIATGQIVSV
jgi:hypothetical protein